MPLTRDFKETVQDRVRRDPKFRVALLREGMEALLAGDVDVGRTVLRDYINATVGFEKLAIATSTPSKSLMRMFGPKGNPQARKLFPVLGYLQRDAGVTIDVRARPRAAGARHLPTA